VRLLNTLYVSDHDVRLSARHQSLEVRRHRQLIGRYPLNGLDAVILTGRAEVTSEALGRCVRHGVRVASVYRSGRLRFTVGGPTSGNVLLRVAQHRAAENEDHLIRLATVLVAGKLQNQRRLVQRWMWDAEPSTRLFLGEQRDLIDERLTGLVSRTDLTPDRIRGFEGDATRRYFKALGAHIAASSGFVFTERNRRPPRDPVNALISYLYGLTTTELVGALDAVGLDPQVGFLHGLRPGRPSLALDLLEEFRPCLDRLAVGLLTRRRLGQEHFELLPGGASQLNDNGHRLVTEAYEEYRSEAVTHRLLRQEVPRAMLATIQATLLARHLRGDLTAYPPYVMDR
jgi:CRISP-associated protein Cas1